MEGGQSFIYAPRRRVALSFYPPTEPPRLGGSIERVALCHRFT